MNIERISPTSSRLRCASPRCSHSLQSHHGPGEDASARLDRFAEASGYVRIARGGVQATAASEEGPDGLPGLRRAVQVLTTGPEPPMRHLRAVATATSVWLLDVDLAELGVLASAFVSLCGRRGW